MNAVGAYSAILYATAGAAVGTLYFVLLLYAVRLQTAEAMMIAIVPYHLMRIGVAISTFWVISQRGAAPLLAALLGFLAARYAVQYWTRTE